MSTVVSSSVVIQLRNNDVILSGSGLLIGSNYVLTSSVWFNQYFQRTKENILKVYLKAAESTIIKRDALLITVSTIPELVTGVRKLLRDVTLPDTESVEDISRLCSIAVLQITGAALQCRDNCVLSKRPPLIASNNVYVRGTPFGDHLLRLFMNSVLVGCICGVCSDGVLFITDCVLPVGCEGAPVYCMTTHSLVGLVLSPISTKAGNPSGLSLCCSISTISSLIRREGYLSKVDVPRPPVLEKSGTVCGVVSVHTASGAWGTGVLIGADVIVTCAHVIRNETEPFTTEKRTGPECVVLYCSLPSQGLDLAILKIDDSVSPHWKDGHVMHNVPLPVTPSDHYSAGDAVAIISYGLVRPCDDNVGPLVTKGAISKVVYCNDIPVMIQTTAVVTGGSSGGILVNLNTGCPIGVVVSYAKDDTNNITYPRLNFCVPLSWIWPSLSDYLITRDPLVFQKLYNEQSGIKEIWQLSISQPSITSKL